MVASIRIAGARPTPNCLKIIACRAAKIAKTPTITIAALVTTPAVVLIPWATACCRAEDGPVPVGRSPRCGPVDRG
jgi:hypothetical protein